MQNRTGLLFIFVVVAAYLLIYRCLRRGTINIWNFLKKATSARNSKVIGETDERNKTSRVTLNFSSSAPKKNEVLCADCNVFTSLLVLRRNRTFAQREGHIFFVNWYFNYYYISQWNAKCKSTVTAIPPSWLMRKLYNSQDQSGIVEKEKENIYNVT